MSSSIVEFAYRGTVYLKAIEVAQHTGIPPETFRRWCRAGHIPNDGRLESRRIGGHWFVTAAWFQRFLQQQAKDQSRI